MVLTQVKIGEGAVEGVREEFGLSEIEMTSLQVIGDV